MKSILGNFLITFKKAPKNIKLALSAMFIISIVQNAYLTIFNLYLSSGGLSIAAIGNILFMSGIGASIIAFPSGILGDKFGWKKFISISSLLVPLLILLQSITTKSQILAILSLLYGVVGLIIHISIYPYLSENTSYSERINVFSLYFLLTNFGGILGSFFSGKLSSIFNSTDFLSLRYTLIMFSLFGFLSIFYTARIKENRRKTYLEKHEIHFKNDFVLAIKFSIQSALIGLGAGLTIPYFNLYFRNSFQLNANTIGIIFSLSSFFFIFFGLFGPKIAYRIGSYKGTIIYEIMSIPFLIILGNNPTLTLAVISFWVRGGLMNAANPLLSSFQMSLISERNRGSISAFLMIIDSLSRSIGTLLGGRIIAKSGFNPNFNMTAILYFASIIYFYFSFKVEAKKIKKEEIAIIEK